MNTSEAHQHFSCGCFNETWRLLDMPDRTNADIRKMIATSNASLFHWLHRDDCTPENLSIGLWQLARVYAVANSPFEAMRNAKDCLDVSESHSLSAFCMAYAHEAVCRAALIGGDSDTASRHLVESRKYAEEVSDNDDRKLIEADLAELYEKLAQQTTGAN